MRNRGLMPSRAILCLIGLGVCLGVEYRLFYMSPSIEISSDSDESTQSPLLLQLPKRELFSITLSGPQVAKASDVRVLATVTNTSDLRFGWDSDWSLFLRWRVSVGDEDATLQSIPLAPRELKGDRIDRRTVMIDPGMSIKKEVALSDSFFVFHVNAKGPFRHGLQHYVEFADRYVFAKEQRTARIELRYNSTLFDRMAESECFPDSRNLDRFWSGLSNSNVIEIKLE
jgi:hypothetical protein